MNNKSLQSLFLSSRGRPLKIGEFEVIQLDRISVGKGTVEIRFISTNSNYLEGVALQAQDGHLVLSDGSKTQRVYTWFEKTLPSTVTYEVESNEKELRVWNIYKASGSSDRTQADAWTNNAGMVVHANTPLKKRYHCSDGMGEFCMDNLVFEIEVRG